MPIHVTFNQLKNSDIVSEHIHELMIELLKITDNKYAFHFNLTKDNRDHVVVINCNYNNKPLISKATHTNLYKALAKSVQSMKVQVLRKAEKLRHE